MGEFAEARDAGWKQAGVDSAGDPWGGIDHRDDGQAGDLDYVPGRQAASLLGDEDDPVRALGAGPEQPAHGEIAGSSEHDVVLTPEELGLASEHSAVDNDGVGARDGRRHDEVERPVHLGDLAHAGRWQAEDLRRALVGRSDEGRRAPHCGVKSEAGRNGRRALAASSAGDQDRPGRRLRLVTGDRAVTCTNVRGRRGAGRASPTRPVTPSGLAGGGHRPAATISSSAW